MVKKIEKVREWLGQNDYDGVFLSRRDNFAWIGEGAENHVLSSTEMGIAYYFITQDSIRLIADSSDMARMEAEQNPLGGTAFLVPWYESVEDAIAGLTQDGIYVSDTGVARTLNVQDQLMELRMELTSEEQERYREIGLLCAEIVEGVCRDARPGMTEMEVANELKCRCLKAGISPDCVLVGADERILNYRHPMPTDKEIQNSLMVVLGGAKYGLNISMTRIVYFGEVPAEIQERYKKTQNIFAHMQTMMEEGLTYGEYFARLQELYGEAGYPEEWKMHHQGGPTGYACREFTAQPGDSRIIRRNQAYAWNPTIQGTKCEETTLLTQQGVEIFTQTPDWPRTVIQTPYGEFPAADILLLPN